MGQRSGSQQIFAAGGGENFWTLGAFWYDFAMESITFAHQNDRKINTNSPHDAPKVQKNFAAFGGENLLNPTVEPCACYSKIY